MRRTAMFLCLVALLAGTAAAGESPNEEWKRALAELQAKLERLNAQVQAQSEQLREQGGLIERQRAEIAGLRAVLEPGPSVTATLVPAVAVTAVAPAATTALTQPAQEKQPAPRTVAGFRFSGDFRYRFDAAWRHPNQFAAALQNIRQRHRVRLNIDREITDRFRFRMQLATAPLNSTLSVDQDYTSTIARHLFTISEAYVDYRAHPSVSLRGGRMEDIFQDTSRFMFDSDARFNGFHQIFRLGERVELRAGQYIFTNPNVLTVTAGSPLALAGARIGSRGRGANLFHQGVVVRRGPHEFIADVQVYRNPNQIQLSLITAGLGLTSAGLGVQLPAPLSGLGNATTTPGGAQLAAGHFQILRLSYGLSGPVPFLGRLPGRLHLQVSRNVGAGKLRDAMMATVQLGRVKKLGDVSGLYFFTIKDANSMLGALSDSDVATQSFVNIRGHHVRVDVGLASFLQWQHLLFFTNFRRASNPAENFFVPFQRGARETVRYQNYLLFVF